MSQTNLITKTPAHQHDASRPHSNTTSCLPFLQILQSEQQAPVLQPHSVGEQLRHDEVAPEDTSAVRKRELFLMRGKSMMNVPIAFLLLARNLTLI